VSLNLRARLIDLYAAYASGGTDFVLNTIDDDIDFLSYAPAEIFPYLGHHHGKAAFAEVMKGAHAAFEFLAYKPVFLVVEGNDAAVMLSMRLRQRSSDRIIHLFVAQFLKFRRGRIYELREFMDTFDAVQQVLGREIMA
jgi:ketosteroid isomerase-like protein